MLNRFMRFAFLGVVVAGLLGCAGAQPNKQVFLQQDEFSNEATLVGIEQLARPSHEEEQDWFLRTFIDKKTHRFNHNIYLDWTYPGSTNGTYTAADDTARSLRVGVIERAYCYFGKCPRSDTLQVEIPDAVLRDRAQQGMRIKVLSQFGYAVILPITSEMIRAQLIALDTYLQGGVLPVMAVTTAAVPVSNAPIPPPPQGATESAVLAPPKINLPFNPNAPGANPADAPPYSVKDSGIGIGYIPMLGSKIKPGMADGLMVSSVAMGSPASLAGIKMGDILTSFDGHSLKDVITAADVFKTTADDLIAKAKPNSTVPVELQRGTTRMKVLIHF